MYRVKTAVAYEVGVDSKRLILYFAGGAAVQKGQPARVAP